MHINLLTNKDLIVKFFHNSNCSKIRISQTNQYYIKYENPSNSENDRKKVEQSFKNSSYTISSLLRQREIIRCFLITDNKESGKNKTSIWTK